MSETVEKPSLSAHRALVQALHDPACYPHPVDYVRLIETHISSVLLTGRFAYKLKKPVNPGFLDYRTLAARRHYCMEELRLNRRLAPRLYLDVVPIGGTPDAPRVGATGGAIEFALKMVEFSQHDLFDRRLADGKLLHRHIDALADRIASFHERADQASESDEWGSPAASRMAVERNLDTLRARAAGEERGIIDALARWSAARHARLAPLMEERRRQGRIRECHGDLHVGNITLFGDEVEIFDCIEFDPALRWIDVLDDLGFLAMDLHAHGRPDYAARLLARCMEASGDYSGTPLLPYYMVYRALVRAMVARLRADQAPPGSADQRAAACEYHDRLALAQRLAATRQPTLMITHGVSGSGKTTVTQMLLEAFGAMRLRSDVERKRLHGLPANARGDGSIYGGAATSATYATLLALARRCLEAGFDTIVDATFLRRNQRDAFRAMAEALRTPFLMIDCRGDPAVLRKRVARRSADGDDASEATVAVLAAQQRSAEPLAPDEAALAVAVESGRDEPAAILAAIRRHLDRSTV